MRINQMKVVAALLGVLSVVLPLKSVRKSYLRAFYAVWDAETGGFDAADLAFESDVYNGHPFEWSRQPVPTLEADRLLAEHDSKVEREIRPDWQFQDLLEQNLHS